MSIVNRDKNFSEQKDNFTYNVPILVGPSSIISVGNAPCAQILQTVVSSSFNVTLSPQLSVQIQRLTPSGITTIPLNSLSLLTAANYASVGMQVHSLPQAPLTNLVMGDLIQVTTLGNGFGVYIIQAVTANLQDVKSSYGV
jgi:hypothetical protein